MAKFFSQGYVPKYVDYDKLPWYEEDLVSYYDRLKHKDMTDDPHYYYKNVKVINFDIIHHKCDGNP